VHESVRNVRRDVAGDIRSQHLGLHPSEKVHLASVDGGGHESCEDAGCDELRQPLRQTDIGRTEEEFEEVCIRL
jgi:hypothetical protein